jgi:hypothetical protein
MNSANLENKQNQVNRKTRVLLAHKVGDKGTAERLSIMLQTPAADRLEFELLEENCERGGWEEADLKAKIDETDLFLLWIPCHKVDKEDWDWFIWAAAGVRWRTNNGDRFPIGLLHNKCLKLPPPLEKATTSFGRIFPNELDLIKDFLRQFYGNAEFTEGNKPLNPFLAEQEAELLAKAKDILELFSKEEIIESVEERSLIPNGINLIVSPNQNINPDSIPADLRVEANTDTLRIFELLQKKWYWEDIVKSLPENESRNWTKELATAMHRAREGKIIQQVKSTFRATNGRIFAPLLNKLIKYNDGSYRFEVFLFEQVSEGEIINAPDVQLSTLLTALTLGARLQWEVCENYLNQLDRWEREGILEKGIQRVKESYNNIEKDAEVRGVDERERKKNEDRILDSFDLERDREEVADNLSEQWRYKDILLNADATTDVSTIKDALSQIGRLNSKLMIKVSRRYSERIAQKYGN